MKICNRETDSFSYQIRYSLIHYFQCDDFIDKTVVAKDSKLQIRLYRIFGHKFGLSGQILIQN